MPLNTYKQVIAKNATLLITIGGKAQYITFRGGILGLEDSTGVFITKDNDIIKALESRRDYGKYGETSGFYLLSSNETEEEKAQKTKLKNKGVIASPEQTVKGVVTTAESAKASPNILGKTNMPENIQKEYNEMLNSMVKEDLKTDIDLINPVVVEEGVTKITNESNSEVTEPEGTIVDVKPDINEINNYFKAKSYLIKIAGATPEDVKNKEFALTFAKSKNIEFPNFK